MPGAIRLIYEFNAYISRPTLKDRLRLRFRLARAVPCVPFASVWIANSPDAPDGDHTQCDEMKLIGPVPEEEAWAFLSRLRRVLEAAGVKVAEEVVADD